MQIPKRILISLACALALTACAASPVREPPPAPEVPAALASLSWLLGVWEAEGAREVWVACADALFGINFAGAAETRAWQVMIVDLAEGRARSRTIQNGQTEEVFPHVEADAERALFLNPAFALQRRIRYVRQDQRLSAVVEVGGRSEQADFRSADRLGRGSALQDAALAQADRDFAAATATRGADGWADAFDAHGAMWRNGRIEGPDAVQRAIAPLFSDPAQALEWTPRYAGPAPAHDLGFTVGDYTLYGPDPITHARSMRGRGAYVTIWRRQTDGRWKVLFDTGT